MTKQAGVVHNHKLQQLNQKEMHSRNITILIVLATWFFMVLPRHNIALTCMSRLARNMVVLVPISLTSIHPVSCMMSEVSATPL